MTRHLEPAPEPPEDPIGLLGDEDDAWDEVDLESPGHPPWWRWVAIAVVVAMIVATPVAYVLYLLLR